MRRIGYLLAALILCTSTPLPGTAPVYPADAVAQNAMTATTTDDVNLRAGPALSYDAIAVIPVESQVTLTGQHVNGYRSVTYNGQDGWAFATYLSIDDQSPSPSESATTTARLNLRTEPTTASDVLTVMPTGARVTLTGENANGFRSVTWAGYTGWASAQFLDFGSTPPPQPEPDTTAITTDRLNLRSGPDVSASVITVMPRGSEVVLTGQESNGYQSVSWNGRNGWAYGEYLTIAGTLPVPSGTATTTDRLNLRSGPDASYTVQTVIPAGAQVALTGQATNGYHSVSWNGVVGWAFSAYLDISANPPPEPDPVIFVATNAIVGPARGSAAEAMAFATDLDPYHPDEVQRYIMEIYRLAPQVGFDPAILVAQSAHETGNWKSYWWFVRLNPAGPGITGDPAQEAASPTFPSGTIAARAQIAHMHAEVYGSSRPLPDILQGVDPTYQRVFAAGWAGTIRTIEDLTGTWAVDPAYHDKLVRKGNLMFGEDSAVLVGRIVTVLRSVLQAL